MSSRTRPTIPPLDEVLGLTKSLTRLSAQVALLPTLTLPQDVRRQVLASARFAAEATSSLPVPFGGWLEEVAEGIDRFEQCTVRREDLGSRRRREARRQRRRTAGAS